MHHTRRRSSSGMPPGRRTAARIACSHWSNASGCDSRPPPAPPVAAPGPVPVEVECDAAALPSPSALGGGGFNVKRRRASSAATQINTYSDH